MSEERVAVTPDELRTAVSVWLKVAPRGIWARFARQSLLGFLKSGERPVRDESVEVADHIAAKLIEAGWTVTRPPIKHPSGSAGR